jgi:hypothetical protein
VIVIDKYLKMADVFVHDSVEELEQHIYAGYMSRHCSEYAAHAINSHDELVQMNQELLAALEDAATSLETIQLRSFGWGSFLDSKPEMRSYAGSRASVVRAAIAKAKGGAAK